MDPSYETGVDGSWLRAAEGDARAPQEDPS